ncbi:restriction endonuclease subunit S [Nostoc sp. UHCC 0252]|uniref:restriction endonuclease subunit S n=1 Tax=Nostoc sp. UHCC 0252 TaxID=3110241 RepID=UPI002B1FE766|nr:restriction endonuclease subunit S [Nostoc sp. UHCC 0252]MEA5603466.1 restriction endonuclease subunit S [Nostoc sp. UHCC 0252]
MKKHPKKTIGELCDIQKGETGILSAIPGEYPLVTTGKERKTSATYQFDTKAVCIPLVSSSGHGKKSLNYVHYQEGKFALGTILAAIVPKNNTDISAAFLHQYLLFYKDIKIVPLMRGAANVSLAVKDIAKIEVPLPPINEQKDFIFLFNKLHKFNDQLVQEFDSQEKYICQLKQAILQEAIAGQLTAEWRDRNPMQKGNPDTDAAALLAKIKAEKQQLITDGKLKKEKTLPEISPDEIPFSLPDSWVWCRFGTFATFERGRFSIRPRNDQSCYGGQYPFIQINSLSRNGDVITEYKQTLNEKGRSVSKEFPKGTIIIAIVGGTIGNLGVLGMNMCFPDSMVGIKPSGIRNQNFTLLLLRYKQPEIKKAAYQMSGQPNIKIPTFTELIIPLPPLAEQKAIVEKVDYLMKIIDQLEEQIKHRKKLAEDLIQTVLREAFE